MTSKVVKVEQVNGLPGNNRDQLNPFERSKTNQTVSTEVIPYGTESSLLPLSRQGNQKSGLSVNYISKDHRENSRQGKYNLELKPKEKIRNKTCLLSCLPLSMSLKS